MSDGARRTRPTLIALGAAVILVVVAALIAVTVRGGPTAFPADAPEGVVQRYSQSVVDGDITTALTYLVPEVAQSCERIPQDSGKVRVSLTRTTHSDDTARVRVLVVTTYSSGLLGANEYESDEVFELTKVDGDWRIRTTPWQLAICVESETP